VSIADRLALPETVKPLLDRSLGPSEDTIATAFTNIHGTSLKFDHQRGCWFEWDGTRWRRDEVERAFHFVRELARTIGKGKRAFAKASTAAGAERFARSHPIHAVQSSVWDADAMLLGTPGGTVDLRTGAIGPPSPDDYITKQTTVSPLEGVPKLWLRFLREALGGDDQAIRFYQQWLGYCLTGLTTEHALLFLYGPGGNGKSVAIDTQVRIQGDYAVTAAMEAFTAARGERHPTELAMLQGARLVTANETEEGRSWNEARVKQLTGGDRITARFMRQDNFTFDPQFKLIIAGNYPPVLHNVDDAMRRRLNIIPFVTKPENPDPLLGQKLRAEHGQILNWMIEGCLDWQRNGLLRPLSVTDATADYFDEQDVFGQWLADRCDVQPGNPRLIEVSGKLFNDWRMYAEQHGEPPGTQRAFAGSLGKRGITRERRRFEGAPQRLFKGVRLKSSVGAGSA